MMTSVISRGIAQHAHAMMPIAISSGTPRPTSTTARQQELAIRAALGLGLAYAALHLLVAKGPATLPRLHGVGVDPVVVAFAFAASVVSGLFVGVLPILKYAGPRVATALRSVGRTFSDDRARHRARNT